MQALRKFRCKFIHKLDIEEWWRSVLAMSEAFDVNTGLRQGDGLSPLLFNLVLEKVVRCLENVPGGLVLGDLLRS